METSSQGPARAHTGVGLSILAVAAGLCAILAFLAHNPAFDSWSQQYRWEESRRSRNIFVPIGHIRDDGDRVLNEEIAEADHTRGGVIFLGTSNLVWALDLRQLSAPLRSLIHNYGVPGTGHAWQLRLLRFLVERDGLLAAGPEKSLVIFGAGYQNAGFDDDDKSGITKLLALHGFFARDPDNSVHRSDVGPIMRSLVMEKVRVQGVADELMRITSYLARDAIGRPRARLLDPSRYARDRSQFLGADWEAKIRREIDALIESVDYLKGRKVPTVVLLMPQGSWEDRNPFDRTYDEAVLEACRSRGVEVIDFRKLLDDEDFADSAHLAPTGVEKFQAAILPRCLDHLRSSGLRPSGASR